MPNTDMQSDRLSKEQKIGFVLLLIFGILTVGLGLLQLRNTIYGPFVVRAEREREAAKSQINFDETARLQATDTDHDGLNDYEELEFYETSPYLPDTDSDGITDAVEIERGTDPLCPVGKTCRAATDSPTTTPALIKPIVESEGSPLDILDTLGQALDPAGVVRRTEAGTPQFDLPALVNDPAALRRLLLQSGRISAAQLDKLDDAALLQLAKEAFAQSATVGESGN